MSNQRCTVFYSWQTDRPNNINRGFIERALEVAAKTIRNDDSIAIDPVIDRDTTGVPGSPDIAHTIFAKIDQAQIFVADVTIINNDKEDRPTPNPNVLVELGYALKTMGPDRVILVMNGVFGIPEQLPFDLRSRRTLVYQAQEGESDRSQERHALEGRFTEALRAVLERLTAFGQEDSAKSLEALKKLRKERIDQIVAGNVPVPVEGSAKLVLQIIPFSAAGSAPEFKVSSIGQDRNDIRFPLLTSEIGLNVWQPNFEGFVASRQMNRSTGLAESYIQFFKDGSLDYVDTSWFRQTEDKKPIMSSLEHERWLINVLPMILKFQEYLGVKPLLVVALSVLGVRGYFLNVDKMLVFRAIPGVSSSRFDRDHVLLNEAVIDSFAVDPAQVMRPAFDGIWNAAGWSESMNYDQSGKWVGRQS